MMKVYELKKIEEFYDGYCVKHLSDYAYGNERMESAICHALKWIPKSAMEILDIGCGIGWSSHEFKHNFPRATVSGVDLCEKGIELAKKLYQVPDLNFSVKDLTSCNGKSESLNDCIVMLDVYEHIPVSSRMDVHQYIKNVLKPSGRLILTCPSISHQNYLRKDFPNGLQPVDEDVSYDDILSLAKDIDGQIVVFDHVTIWNPDDYIHIVIERKSEDNKGMKIYNDKFSNLEKRSYRTQRILEQLNLRPTPDGALLPNQGDFNVCIIHPNHSVCDDNVETFIRAHIERLPSKVRVLYGGSYPQLIDDGTRIIDLPLFQRIKRVLAKRIFKLSEETLKLQAFKRFIRDNDIHAVLAEYGPTGAAVCNACKYADVPLIVHFHGYDAYEYKTIERFKDEYQNMFQKAAAIIAVSKDMEQQLNSLGVPQHKIFVNVYGIDTEKFRGADPMKAKPIFVAVGRFVDKKAPHLTILAFQKVVQFNSRAKLIMIGDGPLLESCQQVSVSLGIDHAVEFLGSRTSVEVAKVMKKARAFVQHSVRPSHGDSEGTPLAILEAGASGLPVVATKHAGIKDVVIDGETGFLVDERDVEGMANYMLQLCVDPQLVDKLGRAARERVQSHYDVNASLKKLSKIIQGCIHG